MKRIQALLILIVAIAFMLAGLAVFSPNTLPSVLPIVSPHSLGDTIDEYDGIPVIYNGSFSNTSGRNKTEDGYNLGLKWQCVEYVKRYYYYHYKHKMPDTYGHAKDFFDPRLADGELNKLRALRQYTNGSETKPEKGDILVLGPTMFNEYGHVAIVCEVNDNTLKVVQQNVGERTREKFGLSRKANGKWLVKDNSVLGWLRKE